VALESALMAMRRESKWSLAFGTGDELILCFDHGTSEGQSLHIYDG
jgi:hypothetical protein